MFKKNKALSIILGAALAVPVIATAVPANSFEAKAATTVSITEFGAIPNDSKDDREAINNAIRDVSEAGGGTITFPRGTFNITLEPLYGVGIELKDNVTLSMSKNTIFKVKGNNYKRYAVVGIKACKNVVIKGGQIHGERKSHGGGLNEDCFGVNIRDAQNIRLENMIIKDNVTDGIYLGTMSDTDNLLGCKQIYIKNCTVSNNGRNNIAIVDADNVTIDSCKIKKANGLQPQCGINIEPNTNGGYVKKNQICNKITIKNTTVTCVRSGVDNNFFAFQIINPYHNSGNNQVVAKNVTISKCTFGGDAGNFSGSKVTIKNSTIKGTFYAKMKTTLKKTKIKHLYNY